MKTILTATLLALISGTAYGYPKLGFNPGAAFSSGNFGFIGPSFKPAGAGFGTTGGFGGLKPGAGFGFGGFGNGGPGFNFGAGNLGYGAAGFKPGSGFGSGSFGFGGPGFNAPGAGYGLGAGFGGFRSSASYGYGSFGYGGPAFNPGVGFRCWIWPRIRLWLRQTWRQ
ncbi:hypothetical protein MTO96_017508 [Rhipicephalus appendiculatus]